MGQNKANISTSYHLKNQKSDRLLVAILQLIGGLSFYLSEVDLFTLLWTTEALANIVDNAVKYTEHGTITISTVSYEMFARIDISDTGAGISESEQSKIFTRFYRSKNVREQEGVGIGLYLSRQIISGEGGYIKVASAPGKGSTFSIFLPK